MNRLKYIIFLFVVFLSVAVVSCDKYNSIVVGEKFAPYNSLVTKFRQLVYIEFREGNTKVWGPCADLVTTEINDSHVTIQSDLDSLVVFAYGSALKDRDMVYKGNITINSSRPYAIYLNGLSLSSDEGPAINSVGKEDCYLVLCEKKDNILYGSASFNGSLIIDGGGNLTINGEKSTALSAQGSITCSYPAKINIGSQALDGVHTEKGDIKIADGTWNINVAGNAFSTTEGQVILNGGTIYASAQSGSFVSAPEEKGLVVSESTVIGVSVKKSPLYSEMRQFIWQAKVQGLVLEADSMVTINKIPNTDTTPIKLSTFKPAYDFKSPWLVVSVPSLVEADEVEVLK